MNLRPVLIGLGTALVLALGVLAGGLRHRYRLGHPRWAAFWDGVGDRLVGILAALILVAVVVAVVAPGPSQGVTGVRLVTAGAALGLVTGLPFAAERRSARRRLRGAAPPPAPLPLGSLAGETAVEARARELLERDPFEALSSLGVLDVSAPRVEDLRVRAVASALLGDARMARACAVRCLQLDAGRAGDVCAAGLLLARAGRFRDGVQLLERAVQAAPDGVGPRLALVEGLRLSGRLREAVSVLDGDRLASG